MLTLKPTAQALNPGGVLAVDGDDGLAGVVAFDMPHRVGLFGQGLGYRDPCEDEYGGDEDSEQCAHGATLSGLASWR